MWLSHATKIIVNNQNDFVPIAKDIAKDKSFLELISDPEFDIDKLDSFLKEIAIMAIEELFNDSMQD